jgi:hypothetical protein
MTALSSTARQDAAPGTPKSTMRKQRRTQHQPHAATCATSRAAAACTSNGIGSSMRTQRHAQATASTSNGIGGSSSMHKQRHAQATALAAACVNLIDEGSN